MKLFEEDDIVEVTTSRSGYKGPGRLVSPAYGTNWLVEKLNCEGENRIIMVSALHMNKKSESQIERQKKKDKAKA